MNKLKNIELIKINRSKKIIMKHRKDIILIKLYM